MRLFTRIAQCSRANPFVFVFTCIPLCFTEPAPQFKESERCVREWRERESAATVCSLFTLPFLVLATEASCQSASRFVIPFIASSHLTLQPVLSPPLPCHDSVTLHLHLHAVNCCNLNWTRRPLVYVLCIYIHTRTHISPSHSHNWAAGVVFAEHSLDSCTVSCFLLHNFK